MRFLEYLIVVILLFLVISCSSDVKNHQLVIANSSLFDTKTGEVISGRTIKIDMGRIVEIKDFEASDLEYDEVINADQRLLTPGFIDVHNHLEFVFGDSIKEVNSKDFKKLRKIFADQYIPYGVLTVRSAGGREEHLSMMKSWMKRDNRFPDYYPTGGALVSVDTKFHNHTFVKDSATIVRIIKDRFKMGFKHLKLYSFIGANQLRVAVNTSNSLGVNIFGHIENVNVSISEANRFGLRNFEHAKTLFLDVIRTYEKSGVDISSLPPDDSNNWVFREYQIFNHIDIEDSILVDIINLFKLTGSTLTPTLHIHANPLGLGFVNTKIPNSRKVVESWPPLKRKNAENGFRALTRLIKRLYDEGVPLSIGSDTSDPGKSVLSEILLLNEAGIPINDVIRIATLNSAEAIGLDSIYGSIEVNKSANLILFDKNPIEDPKNILLKKIVIKDGIVWKGKNH